VIILAGKLKGKRDHNFPKITAGVEAGRLSLLLTLKLNYKPFVKLQWIHEAQVIWIWLADVLMDGVVGG